MPRRPPPPAALGPLDTTVSLRLHDRTNTDWAFSSEGFLLVYDPAVVTDAEFADLVGFQTLAACALGWMAGTFGGPNMPIMTQPEHWGFQKDRKVVAKKVARLVQLGWERAITVLPLVVACNGADVRVTSDPLSDDERKAFAARMKQNRHKPPFRPVTSWITATGPKLMMTWDWHLGFTPRQQKKLFDPGYRAAFACPPGDYQVEGWQFNSVEDADGISVDQFVLRLSRADGQR